LASPGSPDILDEKAKAARAEIAKPFDGSCRAAVAAVIVSVHREPRRDQAFDQAAVPPDVLTHSVRNLDDAPGRTLALPPTARDSQSVCAGKVNLAFGKRHM
jgi:hypothetical protein